MSLWSGTGAITVITSESQHYLQSSLPGWRMWGSGWEMQLPCTVLHFLYFSYSFTHLFMPIFSPIYSFVDFLLSPFIWTHSYSFLSLSLSFSLLQEHMFIYSPLFSVVCKAEFVPVGWKSNEGKSRCYCAAVDCAPPPHPLYWLWAPNKTDAQFVCFQRFLHPSSFQECLITAVFVWL